MIAKATVHRWEFLARMLREILQEMHTHMRVLTAEDPALRVVTTSGPGEESHWDLYVDGALMRQMKLWLPTAPEPHIAVRVSRPFPREEKAVTETLQVRAVGRRLTLRPTVWKRRALQPVGPADIAQELCRQLRAYDGSQ
jgi:hypothetical protein